MVNAIENSRRMVRTTQMVNHRQFLKDHSLKNTRIIPKCTKKCMKIDCEWENKSNQRQTTVWSRAEAEGRTEKLPRYKGSCFIWDLLMTHFFALQLPFNCHLSKNINWGRWWFKKTGSSYLFWEVSSVFLSSTCSQFLPTAVKIWLDKKILKTSHQIVWTLLWFRVITRCS